LFQANSDFRVLCATTSSTVAVTVCRHRRPDVILLDAGLIGRDGCQSLRSFAHQIGEIPIMLLDDEANDARLTAALATPSFSYFTRGSPFPELADGVRQLARSQRAFCLAVKSRIQQTSNGWQFRHDQHRSPLADLTPREIEVLRLIALGNSVRDCAEILKLAASTVDNHKARLMKKLGVHKALELTRLAVREGLVRP
jgi:two-component system invasion response regulator UvrY